MDRYLWEATNLHNRSRTAIHLLDTAYTYVRDTVAKAELAFVGTAAAQTPLRHAQRSQECRIEPAVARGMLTNFRTARGRVDKMLEYERMQAAGDFDNMPKKKRC